jgi:aminoglycoside phosphotransferase (APT) family kinase protein
VTESATGPDLAQDHDARAARARFGPDELGALREWLEREGVELKGVLTASLIDGGKSNLTYMVADDDHGWVLRRPPLGGHTSSAHDVAREYRVIKALKSTQVPVAPTVGSSDDLSIIGAPFTVVEFVDGAAVRTAADLQALNLSTREAVLVNLHAALVSLHQIDPADVGLSGLGKPTGFAQRQLRRWSGQWDAVGARAIPETMTAAREVVTALGDAIPRQSLTRVVHGDYRIDNTLIDLSSGEVRAVVDWELSTLGDPVADVALMCVYREAPLNYILGFEAAWTSARLPDGDELAARYERAGGVPLHNWEFWMALSAYKLAVIAAGIDYRWKIGATVGDGFATAGAAVEPLMDLAHGYAAALKGS